MKKVLLSLLVILLAIAVGAKEKEVKTTNTESEAAVELSGSIVDFHSGEFLVGVEVRIEGSDLKTYTDFDGNFSFKVKPGEYNLVTNYISYEKKKDTYNVEGKNNKVKIELKTSN